MSRRREREPARVWVDKPAPELECSFCLDVFTDPVMLACGHTFCRACAVRWFNAPAKRCPVARCAASANSQPAALPTAYALKSMAEALRMHCRFGLREDAQGGWEPDPEGCPAQLRREEAAAHEAACAHAFELCPFAGCGVERRRRDTDAHDAAAAVAHARGERDERLASQARANAQLAAANARCDALEAHARAASARFAALEARLAAVVSGGAAGGSSVVPLPVTGATHRATLSGHTDEINALALSPDGGTVVSASDDKTLKIWNVATRMCTATLRGHDESVNACSWSPDGRTIVSGSSDRTLKLWDVETHNCTATLWPHLRCVFLLVEPGRPLACLRRRR